jgi:hypothetical protein
MHARSGARARRLTVPLHDSQAEDGSSRGAKPCLVFITEQRAQVLVVRWVTAAGVADKMMVRDSLRPRRLAGPQVGSRTRSSSTSSEMR